MSDLTSAQVPAPVEDVSLTGASKTAPAKRAKPYNLGAQRAAVTGGGIVGRGKSAKTGDPYLIHETGDQQQALRLQAVAGALAGGIFPVREVVSLWQASGVTLTDDDREALEALLTEGDE